MEAQFLAVIAADHASDLLETNPSPPPRQTIGLIHMYSFILPKEKTFGFETEIYRNPNHVSTQNTCIPRAQSSGAWLMHS